MKKALLFIFIILAASGLYAWFHFYRPGSGSASASPTLLTTPDITVNWQTYVNDQWGYSVKYPPDWNKEDLKDTSANIHRISLKSSKLEDAKKSPIEMIVVESQQPRIYVDRLARFNPPNNKTETSGELGGLGAIRFRIQHEKTAPAYVDTVVITQNNGTSYALKCHDATNAPCDFSVFEGLISNFKFLR